MAPKKKSRNAFYYFLMEMRDHNRNKSNQELQDYAGAKWNNMTQAQRKVYEDRAALLKNDPTSTKYTSDGKSIESMQQQAQDQENKEQKAKQDIKQCLMNAYKNGVLDEELFLIVHFNKLVYYPKDDRYFTCEVGISAFNLRDGVKEVFHRLIKPGKLPLGFFGDANIYSKQSHQLVDIIYNDESYEDNTDLVFEQILQFIKKFKKDPKLPPLYTMARDLEMVQNIFQNWRYDFNFEEEINVYNLEYLFQTLKNTAVGSVVWTSDSYSSMELEKDSYSHTTDISCRHHEEMDNTVNCSKSIVTRYVYIICNFCCNHLNIQLIPGRHLPKGAMVKDLNIADSRSQTASSFDNFSPNAVSSEKNWFSSAVSETTEELQWMTVGTRRNRAFKK